MFPDLADKLVLWIPELSIPPTIPDPFWRVSRPFATTAPSRVAVIGADTLGGVASLRAALHDSSTAAAA
ncbi:hypothetical protein JCM1841_006497 [Sporobolomyces salmonicolor]